MGSSNANGHSGAQGNQSPPRGRTHAGVTRLMMLMAVVLSVSHGEAHVSSYVRTLILRSIPIATALSSQTITFPALSGRAYGVPPFTVSATASSGLPVSFASLTLPVCTTSGNTVTIVAAGTCTIRASQAGNPKYSAAANVDQSLQVTSNTGPAPPGLVLTPTLTYAVGSVPKALAIADFNGDGKPDMAVINESSGTVSILLGGGDGTFAAAATLVTGAVPTQIVAGDFNGDGQSDLAVTNLFNNSVRVFLGNADGTFQFPTTIDIGAPAYGLAASDLNGDGKLDLVVTNAAGGVTGHTLQVLLGKGDGTFQPAVGYATGSDPFAVVIGDLNLDGALDLVVTNNSSHDFSTLLGNGSGAFHHFTGRHLTGHGLRQ